MAHKARRVATILVVGVAIAALACGVGVAVVRSYVHSPLGISEPTTATFGRGRALKSALNELGRQGLVRHPRWLYWYAQAVGQTRLCAGEYLVEPADTPATLLYKLHKGKVRTETFTVVEGHNRWQVRDALVAKRWLGSRDFDALCDSTSFLARHNIPGPSCEGYLFPETYTFARGLAAEAVLGAMLDMFHRVYAEVTASGRGPMQLDMRQLTTLASIVEKETGAPQERPHIGCVFYNRLTAKPAWRLETDPTVIYAVTLVNPKFDGNLKRQHLHGFSHPYNTYEVYGLPPGPIANPGRAALAAVVTPDVCADFFFVATNNGRHFFCPTLACHNQAVEKWQLHRRSARRGL